MNLLSCGLSVGQKHQIFRGFRASFPLCDIRKNPRSMYARVPQAMSQFVPKVEKLSQIMGTAPVVKLARLRSPSLIMASGITYSHCFLFLFILACGNRYSEYYSHHLSGGMCSI